MLIRYSRFNVLCSKEVVQEQLTDFIDNLKQDSREIKPFKMVDDCTVDISMKDLEILFNDILQDIDNIDTEKVNEIAMNVTYNKQRRLHKARVYPYKDYNFGVNVNDERAYTISISFKAVDNQLLKLIMNLKKL